MELVFAFESWQVPFLAIGAGFLALAVWLVVLDFRSRLNRAFALYLFLDGAPEILRPISFSTPDGFALRAVGIVMTATAPLALVYFVLAFEERFGTWKWRRFAFLPLVALAGIVAFVAARALTEVHMSGAPVPGLLEFVGWLQILAPSLAALLFGYESTRSDTGRRRALQLASLAFALGPPFAALHLFIPGLMPGVATTSAIALAPIGLLVLYMARVAATTADPALASESKRFLIVLALPSASVALLWLVSLASMRIAATLMVVLMGVWMLALPVLATYALVRHRLFGFDAKLRWGISKSTIAGVFIAVFFIASETAQQFLGESLGSAYVGIAAAGALVFALAPLQRAAERLAERAVPPSAAKPERARDAAIAREAAYLAGLRAAMQGGELTREQEHHLAELAGELGLPAKRALELRELIESEHAKEAV